MFACSYYRRLCVDVWSVHSVCNARVGTSSLNTLAWLSTVKSYIKTSPCVLTPEARTSASCPKPLGNYNTTCTWCCNACFHDSFSLSLSHKTPQEAGKKCTEGPKGECGEIKKSSFLWYIACLRFACDQVK